MKSFFKAIIVITLPLILWEGCYNDNFNELHPSLTSSGCDTTKVMSFSADIMPIMNTSCGTANSCHGTSNTSGIDLTGYTGVDAIALNGKLVSCVIWDGVASQMPKSSATQISVCDQTKIKKWVSAGSLNN